MNLVQTGKTLELTWEVEFTYSDEYIKLDSPRFCILRSDNFNTHNCQLIFYPNGSRSNFVYPRNWASLYICNFDQKDSAEVLSTLSFLNRNNEKIAQKTLDKTILRSQSVSGFPNFVEKTLIKDPNNKIFMNNQLTILCEIFTENTININQKSYSRLEEFDKFEKLLSNDDFSDAIIAFNGKNLYAHKCILASRSPVFNAMFKHDMKEKNQSLVKIEDIEFEVFQELIRFIYTGKVNNVEKIVCQLLTAAEKYSVEGLKTLCEDVMCSDINKANALEYLCAANMNNATNAEAKIISWISTCLEDFVEKAEFKSFGIAYPELFYNIILKTYKK